MIVPCSIDHVFCIQADASVRCLVWWGESCVLIGCLDGKVYQWSEQERELKVVCETGGSVIVMKWDHSKQVHVHVLVHVHEQSL